ncbi:GLPGLI family protein [Chryseobacterium culicis]|uniref:GLPGLI family protein n=1 Tax=Chryseobacterium culicis TaxID=680127 RepID=A0A2S9CWK6_CHRCI|nr:GLPGLI family protein [Chryseobacterium culicis]PRB84887.1 GLPGLI family protein [Chryseobacterium culicis]PRB87713.1 GLPGLI family protein [Chryseobacterium culicis]
MKALLFILLFISNILAAQNITFIYEFIFRTEKKDVKQEYYYLDVLGKQSVFRSEKAREADSLMQKNGYWQRRQPIFENMYSFKNLISNTVYKSITHPSMYDLYYINIDDRLQWQILSDTMKIGDVECQKAVTKYGGRKWIAWFDRASPLQDGPYIFYGLPGLIIKLSDEQKDFDFNLIKIKKSDKNNMFYLRKGKEITWDVYKKLQIDYYNDPLAEIKIRNIKTKIGDANGNSVNLSFKEITTSIQNQIKGGDNPIELDKAVKYP